jgi:hypothetical protein
MSDIDSRAMELMCLQCAKIDPENDAKWLVQAEHWRAVSHGRTARNFQRKNSQQMHAGPMAMGPNTVNGDKRPLRFQLGCRVGRGLRKRTYATKTKLTDVGPWIITELSTLTEGG